MVASSIGPIYPAAGILRYFASPQRVLSTSNFTSSQRMRRTQGRNAAMHQWLSGGNGLVDVIDLKE